MMIQSLSHTAVDTLGLGAGLRKTYRRTRLSTGSVHTAFK